MSHLLVALSEAAATIRYKRATRRNTPGPLGLYAFALEAAALSPLSGFQLAIP